MSDEPVSFDQLVADRDGSEGADQAQPESEEVLQLRQELDNERRRANGILGDLQNTRRDFSDLRGRFDVLATNFAGWQEAQNREQEQENLPDDPFERLEVTQQRAQEQQQQQIQQLQEAIGSYAYQQTQQQQFQQAVQTAVAQEQSFRAENPDYDDAFNFMKDLSTKYLRGQGLTEDQIQQTLVREQLNIVQGAMSRQQNPAEVIYGMARSMGFDGSGEQLGHDQAAPATPTPTVPRTPTSLSNAQKKGSARFNLAALADEDEEAFNEIAQDPEKWRKYMIQAGHPV